MEAGTQTKYIFLLCSISIRYYYYKTRNKISLYLEYLATFFHLVTLVALPKGKLSDWFLQQVQNYFDATVVLFPNNNNGS